MAEAPPKVQFLKLTPPGETTFVQVPRHNPSHHQSCLPSFIGLLNDRLALTYFLRCIPLTWIATLHKTTKQLDDCSPSSDQTLHDHSSGKFDTRMDIFFPYSSPPGSPSQMIKAFQLWLTNDLSQFQLMASDSSLLKGLRTPNSGVLTKEFPNPERLHWILQFSLANGPELSQPGKPIPASHPFGILNKKNSAFHPTAEVAGTLDPQRALNAARLAQNEAARQTFAESVADLTQGSVKVLFSETDGTKMERIGAPELGQFLFALTCVFPWALSVLLEKGVSCVMTDGTFKSLRPYVLEILHVIVANESIPIAFGITPTETGDSYVRIFDHINELLHEKADAIARLQESGSIREVPSHPGPQPAPPAPEDAGSEPAVAESPHDAAQPREPAGPTPDDTPASEDTPDLRPHQDRDAARGGADVAAPQAAQAPPGRGAQRPQPARRPNFRGGRRRARTPPPKRTILTDTPLVSDQGAGLLALIRHFMMIWHICHRHIIESAGSGTLIGFWVTRILFCFSEAEYARTCGIIKKEMVFLARFFNEETKGYNVLLALLGEGDPNHVLADINRWALWKRIGEPNTDNSGESVHGHLNADVRVIEDWVERLRAVIEHLMKRYSKRGDWIDTAFRRNARKCFPTPEEMERAWFSADRQAFYRALHNAEGLKEFRKRQAPLLNQLLLVARSCSSTVTSTPPPPNWEDHPADSVISESLEQPDMLRLPATSATTRLDHTAWTIAHRFYHRIGERKWAEYATSVLATVVRIAQRLDLPEHDELTEDQEAGWYAEAWKEVTKLIES
jgi:hypothetical protein